MQQAKILYLRPDSYINDITNINLIDDKANIKGTCNKDDINILAHTCVRVRTGMTGFRLDAGSKYQNLSRSFQVVVCSELFVPSFCRNSSNQEPLHRY